MSEQIAEYIIPIVKDGYDTIPDFINGTQLIRCKDCEYWVPDYEEHTMYCGQEILPTTECASGEGFCSMAMEKE